MRVLKPQRTWNKPTPVNRQKWKWRTLSPANLEVPDPCNLEKRTWLFSSSKWLAVAFCGFSELFQWARSGSEWLDSGFGKKRHVAFSGSEWLNMCFLRTLRFLMAREAHANDNTTPHTYRKHTPTPTDDATPRQRIATKANAHGPWNVLPCRIARNKQFFQVYHCRSRATLNEVGLVLLKVMVLCLAHVTESRL